jgi:hypothetical protein
VSAEPRSGHELTVFLIPAHLGGPAARAVDLFVAQTRGANAEYAWFVADVGVRAWTMPTPDPAGSLVATHGGTGPDADLTEGFAMAVSLARRYVDGHDDGLPVAADILVVADARCRFEVEDTIHSRAGELVQAGMVLHRHPGAVPAGLFRRDTENLEELGWAWLELRAGHRSQRLPRPVLG